MSAVEYDAVPRTSEGKVPSPSFIQRCRNAVRGFVGAEASSSLPQGGQASEAGAGYEEAIVSGHRVRSQQRTFDMAAQGVSRQPTDKTIGCRLTEVALSAAAEPAAAPKLEIAKENVRPAAAGCAGAWAANLTNSFACVPRLGSW